jgi:CheY-like chemotaxis protein
MKILVADDEEHCRSLIRAMFANEPDVELVMTADGAEAWWRLTEPKQRFDLGIFDLRMTAVDGLALIERIRAAPLYRNLPIILCTGVSDRDIVARAARLAINHYVVKPYRADSLREKILTFAPKHGGPERTLLAG